MHKQEMDIKDYAQHANNVLAWLQTINKTKTSPRQPLEQQLQSLSLSYKNAQEKLLSLQKQVYYESLHNEKQRSIIEILKYIINGNLDDDTILTYLVDMQDQSMQDIDTKYQIKTQLQQIKDIVLKRKSSCKKNQSLKAGAIADLKKELNKCNQVKRELMEDLDRTLNEKGELQALLQQFKAQISALSKQTQELHSQLQTNKNNQTQILQTKHLLQLQIESLKQEKQTQQQTIKGIKSQISRIIKCEESALTGADSIMREFKKIQSKLEKYRNAGKDLADKLKKQSKHNQYIDCLKMFLPPEALNICAEFEKSNHQCFLKQMEGLAKLQKKKYSQLQTCQQEVWRLKSKLLRQGDSWVKSKRTGVPNSQDKQNIQPNQKQHQNIQEFKFDL